MIRDAAGLVAAGLATPEVGEVARRYAVAITPEMQALIEHADDPIGRQFIPDPAELLHAPHETADPIGDEPHSPLPGLVHRYPDRVLLKPLLVCPVYCRFCFRREHVGPGGGMLTADQLEAAYAYIEGRPAIREVILTGGDPLMLSPRRLGELLTRLAAIPHVELLRLHTRVPVAEPSRVTNALAARPGAGEAGLARRARQPRPRVHARGPRRAAADPRARRAAARAKRAAARRQRQRRRAGSLVPRHACGP